MNKFEKVSYKQFKESCDKLDLECNSKVYENIKLPTRATKCSAGYDFVSPFDFHLEPNETILIPTGIRVQLDDDKVLGIVPRSGLGFKTGMSLANTFGVIDSDYYGSNNEGHIMAKFVGGFAPLDIKAGDRVMQGIIFKYFTLDNESVDKERNGGFGSTDENKR